MNTIREEEAEEGKGDSDGGGSDTGYFTHEADFNNRDEQQYDSQEEEEYR